MSARFLLDTNIVSDLMRHPQGAVQAAIAKAGETSIATSVIVAAELRYGALKQGSARLSARVEAILNALDVLSFDAPADAHYGRIRADLHRRGQLIGPNDLLIAAHALALNLTLVTDNEREFSRVAGLKTENWLR